MLDTLKNFLPGQKNIPLVIALRLEGAIHPKARPGRGLSLAGLEKLFEKAFKIKQAKAIALLINSPGGAAVQSRLIATRLKSLKKQYEKPLYAFCEDVAASGGYMIASAADEIYAMPDSLVGSIGVVGGGFGFPEILKKIGLERRTYAAGKNKVRLDPFTPEKPEDKKWIHGLLKDVHEEFIALVREARGDRLTTEQDLFSGDVWIGRHALELGLVDGLGELHDIVQGKYGEETKIKFLTGPKPGLSQRLLGTFSSELDYSMEARALWSRYGL